MTSRQYEITIFGGLFMGKKERFSLRKYKVGLVSVLIGAVFLAGHVTADEVNSALQVNQVGIEQAVQVVDSSQAVDETQVELAIEQTSEVSSQTVNQDGLNCLIIKKQVFRQKMK